MNLTAQDFGALFENREGSTERKYEKAMNAPIFKVPEHINFGIIFNFFNILM